MTATTTISFLFGFFGVLMLLGALLGLYRRTKRAAVHFVVFALAATLAVLLSGAFATVLDAAKVEEILIGFAEKNPESAALFTDLASLSEAIATLLPFLQGLLRPLLFAVLLILISVILWVIMVIVGLFIRKKKNKNAKKRGLDRLLGAAIGLVQGLLLAALLVTPAVGYLAMADDIATAYLAEADSDVADDVRELQADLLTPLRENAIVRATESVTAPVFSLTSAFRVGDTRTTVMEEAPTLLKTADTLLVLGAVPFSEYGESECDALREVTDLFSQSALLPPVTAEMLSTVAGKWQEGEAFLGIEAPEVEGELAPITDALLEVLASSTVDTVERDLETVADFLILAVDYGMLADAEGEDIYARAIEVNPATGKTFIKAAVALLDANPHMLPLRNGITAFGATLVADKLGTPEDIRENYGEMVTEAVDVLKNAEGDTDEEKIASLTPVLRDELAEEGIDLPDDVVDEASRYVLDELDRQGITLDTLTEDDVYDILDRLAAGEFMQ